MAPGGQRRRSDLSVCCLRAATSRSSCNFVAVSAFLSASCEPCKTPFSSAVGSAYPTNRNLEARARCNPKRGANCAPDASAPNGSAVAVRPRIPPDDGPTAAAVLIWAAIFRRRSCCPPAKEVRCLSVAWCTIASWISVCKTTPAMLNGRCTQLVSRGGADVGSPGADASSQRKFAMLSSRQPRRKFRSMYCFYITLPVPRPSRSIQSQACPSLKRRAIGQ